MYVRLGRTAATVLVAALVVGGVAAQGAGTAWANDGGQGALFVSPSAHPGAGDWSCDSAAYTTIGAAVSAAKPWATVVVCEGTYHEQVVLSKPVSLESRGATIDESGVTPAFSVTLPPAPPLTIDAAVVVTSSNVEVGDFTITGALGEGILAAGVAGPISRVDINNNKVVGNDRGGGVPPASTYFECAVNGQIPGDCGEGIHLMGVADSVVNGNDVSGNSGGILLTDETGPNHGNLIEANVVTQNLFDCGITAPGHNPHALDALGNPQPAVGGVYDNRIIGNRITGNGTLGEGAGVLFANAGPGTASYDNLVEGNYIAGNKLSGVTMHAHTLPPGLFEDLNGNDVIGNWIGKNNLGGDPLDSAPPPAPPGTKDTATTGVLVFSGGTPITLRIADNHVSDNAVGIWLSKAVTAHGLDDNSFEDVATQVSAGN